MRFIRVLVLIGLAALLVAPIALALRFSDGSLTPPSGIVGQRYIHELDGEGGCNEGDYDIRVTSGNIPPGLSLQGSDTDWRIEGTPTTPGTYGFWLELKGYCPWFPTDNKTAERAIEITIAPGLTIDQGAVPTGMVGTPNGLKLTASGGGTQRWTLTGGTLPPGVSFAGDGTFAGTPTTKGDYVFSVKVDDGAGRANAKDFTLAVRNALEVQVAVPKAEVGTSLSLTPKATGGSETYSAWAVAPETPLPAGLTLNAATGAITGIPTAAGTFLVKLTVTDSETRTKTVDVSLVIAPKLAIRTAKLRAAKAGKPYQATLRSLGGVGAVTWKLVRVRPVAAVRLDRSTGTLTWTPRVGRIYTLVFRAQDELKATADATLTLDVKAKPKPKKKRG
jgi:hypothetical protein